MSSLFVVVKVNPNPSLGTEKCSWLEFSRFLFSLLPSLFPPSLLSLLKIFSFDRYKDIFSRIQCTDSGRSNRISVKKNFHKSYRERNVGNLSDDSYIQVNSGVLTSVTPDRSCLRMNGLCRFGCVRV